MLVKVCSVQTPSLLAQHTFILIVLAPDPHIQPATPSSTKSAPAPYHPLPPFLLVVHPGCTDQRGACLPRSPPPRTTRQTPPPLPPRPEWVPTIYILTHGRLLSSLTTTSLILHPSATTAMRVYLSCWQECNNPFYITITVFSFQFMVCVQSQHKK